MANTVGSANFRITLTGDAVVTSVTSALLLTLGGEPSVSEIRVRRRSSTRTKPRSQLLALQRRRALPFRNQLLLQGYALSGTQLAEHGVGFGRIRVVVEHAAYELQGPPSVTGFAFQARE